MNVDRIDADGFRANVGMILMDGDGRVLVGARARGRGWQFPQGGIRRQESAAEAMYRELREEVGLQSDDVEALGSTRGWLHYRLPEQYQQKRRKPLCIGQKQRWFLLRLRCPPDCVRSDATAAPEFDRFRWVHYWAPVSEVIYFKRQVYASALTELRALVRPPPPPPPRWWPRHWRRSVRD